jgi:hypothetical protein
VRDDEAAPATTDVPLADRMWDGLLAWMSGTFAVCGAALAISTALGFPRRAAAELSGGEIGFLITQAVACAGFVLRTGWRQSHRYLGAVAVAFAAGVPGALAVLMALAWHDAREPAAGWPALLRDSLRLAALEAAPGGYLLFLLRSGSLRLPGRSRPPETS